MLRQDSAGIESQSNPTSPADEPSATGVPVGDATRTPSVDIQRELSRLEEMILESPRVPFTRRTLIDEEQILDHLDKIRLSLPSAFQDASALLQRQEEILQQAEQYAREVVEAAERQANGILDEMGIVRQAKVEADRVRQQVQIDCEAAQEQTIAEIEQLQMQAQQELEAMRARAIAEASAIETGADEYADRVLRNIEQQLSDMLRVIRNGRQQLQQESAYRVHDRPTNTD
ncbi:MAG TPA: DivIVA domain-containing protein [Oscillatoriales cyanobacterium M59_W2019_021]|nr:DivIVA domain-containing protein [Oscillatoriales cyanobacterium M4454_W2019_049]HIK52579.1 DivIVA domain-containing protein [Oscillatoriales cyanobacterium M59_W2019_021]